MTDPQPADNKVARQLSGEDKVVIGFSLLGLIGSIALYLLGLPSVMISFFLSAGLVALVYRFLGGIQGASFKVGAMKLTGTAAALCCIAFLVDPRLETQQKFHLISDNVMVGEWEWEAVGPSASWDGYLTFTKVGGQLRFSGKEFNLEKVPGGTKRTLLLEMTNGKASMTHRNGLTLESEVTDYQYHRNFRWKSVEPFVLVPAFVGRLRPEKHDDPNLESNPWGMLIYKKRGE